MSGYRMVMALMIFALGCFVGRGAFAQCSAPSSWFPHATITEPDFHEPSSNCEFHQWAWHEFLWLTRPGNGGRIPLLNLPTEDSLFSPGRAPAPLESAEMQNRMNNQKLRLTPRVAKSEDSTPISGIHQAGRRGILVDTDGQPVYYASFVSKEYYEFVRANQLYLKPNYVAASATLNFPKKAVELKSAWKVVPSGDSVPNFYTTKALVPVLKCSSGGPTCSGSAIVVDMTQTKEVTVALVGLHVVGVVEGHPEFVWSTFEHIGNAPDLPVGVDPTSMTVVSNSTSTFYKAGTAAVDCNRLNSVTVQLDETTKKLSPVTNVFRQFAFGGGDATDTGNIQALNQSVHNQLAADSVWKNYMLVGGVWFMDGTNLQPGKNGSQLQPFVAGSVQLSNSTMETFTQQPQSSPAGNRSNCFSCHATSRSGSIPAKNLNISHILKQGLIEREQFHQLARLNLSLKQASAMDDQGVTLENLATLAEAKMFAAPAKGSPLMSYADVQKCLNDFVAENNVPIGFSPHGAFWQDMTYDQFTTGNIPGIVNPVNNQPLKVIELNNAEKSNLIMALRGTPGTIFDPTNGQIGQMPPSGPFMSANDIQRIADWINVGAPR
jgi:hypothetical protein